MRPALAAAVLALIAVASSAQAKIQYLYTVSDSHVGGEFGAADISGTFTTGTATADYTSDVTVTDLYNVAGDYTFTGSNFNNWVVPSQNFPGLTAVLGIFEIEPVTGTYNASFTDGIIDYAGTVELTVTPYSPAPEPATWGLMVAGLSVVGGVLRGARRGRMATA